MGLPPELPITVDDSMLKGFQLVPVEANEIIESLNQLQERIGWLSQVVELRGSYPHWKPPPQSFPDSVLNN